MHNFLSALFVYETWELRKNWGQLQAIPCGIYVGQIGSETVISTNNLDLPCYYYSTNDSY